MGNFSKENSEILDNVRIPLALGVLLSHASCVVDSELMDANSVHGLVDVFFYWLYTFLYTIFPTFVIPGFFLISGYLFFLKWPIEDGEKIWDTECYAQKLKSRFFTLFIPYVLWNIIPLLLIIIECIILHYDSNDFVHELKFCLQGKFPKMFWDLNEWGGGSTGPLNLPLYYLRDLMGMCLVAPVVYLYCRKFKAIGVCFLVVINILGYIPSLSGLRNTGITFFTLGAFFSIYRMDVVENLSKCGKYLFFPSIMLIPLVLGVVKVEGSIFNIIIRLFCVTGLISMFWIVKFISKTCVFKKISLFKESIFFMYAAHEGLWILNFSVFICISLIQPSSICLIFVQYIFSIVLTIFFCIFIYIIIKNIMPNLSEILNGKYKYVFRK